MSCRGAKLFEPTVVVFPILLSSSGPNFGNTSDNFDKVILRHESADNPEKVRRAVIERYPAIIYFARRPVGDLWDVIRPRDCANSPGSKCLKAPDGRLKRLKRVKYYYLSGTTAIERRRRTSPAIEYRNGWANNFIYQWRSGFFIFLFQVSSYWILITTHRHCTRVIVFIQKKLPLKREQV